MTLRNSVLKSIFVIFLLLACRNGVAQSDEAVFSDLKSCTSFYWQSSDIIKQIKKSHDTSTYFHDAELIIFFNQKETKRLSKNTFYIFNHGFNKLFSLQIGMIQIEASNSKKDKKVFITNPSTYFNVFYEDSLARCNRIIAGPLEVRVPGYKKAEISALLVQIKYYNQVVLKWFLRQPDILENITDVNWQEKSN